MKKIAVIIVTYNGEKWITKCMDCLLASTYPADVFVVDNCSTDSTLSLLKAYDIFDLEVSRSNLGFGAANNVALKKALKLNYDYFFLINQDLYIQKDTIEKLIEFSDIHPEAGIIAPVQYDGDGREVDANFKQYITLSQEKKDDYETSFVNAAAWLISRQCLQTTGGFSSMFPHYGEDRDFCNRVKYHGFYILIKKDTHVMHDRLQKMSLEKAIKLSKIKLLTIFLNPNFSKNKSIMTALFNVFGMGKYFMKKYYSASAFLHFVQEFIRLYKQRDVLEAEKRKSHALF